jgi:hypothetical protein
MADRFAREIEREQREHQARREEIKGHLAHVRQSVATLTGRVTAEEPPPAG